MQCIYCGIFFSSMQNGRTCLMQASQNGHTEVVVELIRSGVNVDAQATVRMYSKSMYRTKVRNLTNKQSPLYLNYDTGV